MVTIASRATSFTAVCESCVALDDGGGWAGSTFGGRLDLDLAHGTYLCRRGHSVRVERADTARQAAPASAVA